MLQSGFDAAGKTNRKVCLSMKWDWERARERLNSKKYQKYYWLAYMVGTLITSTLFTAIDGFTITKLLRNFLPFAAGGTFGLIILFLLMKDKRFE